MLVRYLCRVVNNAVSGSTSESGRPPLSRKYHVYRRASSWPFLYCSRDFRVSGFGFRVSMFGFRVSEFGYRVSGFGFRVPGFGFRVSGFGVQVSGFRFRVSGFGFRVSGFGFRVLGFRASVFGVWAPVVSDGVLLAFLVKRALRTPPWPSPAPLCYLEKEFNLPWREAGPTQLSR